jgi:hypothetical protein
MPALISSEAAENPFAPWRAQHFVHDRVRHARTDRQDPNATLSGQGIPQMPPASHPGHQVLPAWLDRHPGRSAADLPARRREIHLALGVQ